MLSPVDTENVRGKTAIYLMDSRTQWLNAYEYYLEYCSIFKATCTIRSWALPEVPGVRDENAMNQEII